MVSINPITGIRQGWASVWEFRRAYLVLNLIFYGLVIVGMAVAYFHPEINHNLIPTIKTGFTSGPLGPIGRAYTNQWFMKAFLLTFMINFLAGSFFTITVPSLVVPFIGLLTGFVRAVLWGVLCCPFLPDAHAILIPHQITLLLEGQAYILTMLAAYAQGTLFLFPARAGLQSHGAGFSRGLKVSIRIYTLVIFFLIVAALYESFLLTVLAGYFK